MFGVGGLNSAWHTLCYTGSTNFTAVSEPQYQRSKDNGNPGIWLELASMDRRLLSRPSLGVLDEVLPYLLPGASNWS